MRRSPRFGVILVAAGVALSWVDPRSLVLAQQDEQDLEVRERGKSPVGEKAHALPRISLLSLQVTRPLPPTPNGPPAMFRPRPFGFQRFGMQELPLEGTTLTFLVEEPERSMIGLDMKDCEIVRFRDDKNTDLTKTEATAPPEVADAPAMPGSEPGAFSFSGDLDDAGHRATITVHSPRFPASGANRLLLDARLVMRYGHGEKVVEQRNVDLKADKITVGPIPMLVMKQDLDVVGRGDRNRTQVSLHHVGPLREIRKIAFLGQDGQEIKSTQSGSGQSGNSFQEHYTLEQAVDTCTIRLTIPETIETVTTAVSIETGIGFPPFVRRKVVPAQAPPRVRTGPASN